VFSRVRQVHKKEKDASFRCCVRINNHSDVYLTKFATPNNYLWRVKRMHARHKSWLHKVALIEFKI